MSRAARIATLNDATRRDMRRWVSTLGLRALEGSLRELYRIISRYDDFTPDNDPYHERDFGAFDFCGERCFWKLDYYDHSLEYHSEDPTDPAKTRRVLTVMLASEY